MSVVKLGADCARNEDSVECERDRVRGGGLEKKRVDGGRSSGWLVGNRLLERTLDGERMSGLAARRWDCRGGRTRPAAGKEAYR